MCEVTSADFEEQALRASQPVLVDFRAPWCGPYRAAMPVIEQIANERPDLRVVKLNIEEEPALAAQYGVVSIPTIVRFDGGEPSQTLAGLKPKPVLKGSARAVKSESIPYW